MSLNAEEEVCLHCGEGATPELRMTTCSCGGPVHSNHLATHKAFWPKEHIIYDPLVVGSVKPPASSFTARSSAHGADSPVTVPIPNSEMRTFDTGATRSAANSRPMYTGYLSPIVLQRFGEYMTKHRVQKDGTLRNPDNWTKGMPRQSYLDGFLRHFLHLWLRHHNHAVNDPEAGDSIEEDLCASLFNVQGYLHEVLLGRDLGK